MSGRIRPGSPGYCSMTDNESGAASFENEALPETLDLVADVLRRSVSDYYVRYGRLQDARRFAEIFSDSRSKTIFGHRGMCYDTDIGAWEQRWSMLCQQCVVAVSLAGSFDMPFISHGDEAAYLSRMYALFWRYHYSSTEEKAVRLDKASLF